MFYPDARGEKEGRGLHFKRNYYSENFQKSDTMKDSLEYFKNAHVNVLKDSSISFKKLKNTNY